MTLGPLDLRRIAEVTAIPLGVIAIWMLIAHLHLVNRVFLPAPYDVLLAGFEQIVQGNVLADVGATLLRVGVGLAMSFLLGLPLGIACGCWNRLYRYLEFLIDFFRSIPSSALFFAFVLMFGLGDLSKIAIIVYACTLILTVSVMYGARPTHTRVVRSRMLKSFGATRRQILWFAVLPEAAPHILAGIRVCLSVALVVVIVAEMFLGTHIGIGRRIYDAYLSYRIAEMYFAIILLGSVGYVLSKCLSTIERRLRVSIPETI